jgi:hypothetical protein
LILETSGPDSSVVKLLPPLVIDDESLHRGLNILARSFEEVMDHYENRIAEIRDSNESQRKQKGFDA